jgi:hypothetical protein
MIKPKVVLLIFVSGKIVLTGAKVSIYSLFSAFSRHLWSTDKLSGLGSNPSADAICFVIFPRDSGPGRDLHGV